MYLISSLNWCKYLTKELLNSWIKMPSYSKMYSFYVICNFLDLEKLPWLALFLNDAMSPLESDLFFESNMKFIIEPCNYWPLLLIASLAKLYSNWISYLRSFSYNRTSSFLLSSNWTSIISSKRIPLPVRHLFNSFTF